MVRDRTTVVSLNLVQASNLPLSDQAKVQLFKALLIGVEHLLLAREIAAAPQHNFVTWRNLDGFDGNASPVKVR